MSRTADKGRARRRRARQGRRAETVERAAGRNEPPDRHPDDFPKLVYGRPGRPRRSN